MNLDAPLCYCFRVSRRKLLSFIRVERPVVASQLAQCGGAGTGCGWCVPFLKQLFVADTSELDQFSDDDYAAARQLYLLTREQNSSDSCAKTDDCS
jgi:NAD(P)H-nitrite reductase large subunit